MEGEFLFLLFFHFHSCSSFFPVPLFHLHNYLLSLFSLSLGDDTKCPTRVDLFWQWYELNELNEIRWPKEGTRWLLRELRYELTRNKKKKEWYSPFLTPSKIIRQRFKLTHFQVEFIVLPVAIEQLVSWLNLAWITSPLFEASWKFFFHH